MENVTKDTLLYEIETKITETKEQKAKLVAEKREVPSDMNKRIDTLVFIKSELITCNKSNVYHLTKDKELIELNKMANTREQDIKDYTDAKRPELAEEVSKELQIIKEFLPTMPSEEEIVKFINEKIDEHLATKEGDYKLSMRDMGAIKTMVGATYPTVNGKLIQGVLMKRING
jgi:uncharacterized protein YqeY